MDLPGTSACSPSASSRVWPRLAHAVVPVRGRSGGRFGVLTQRVGQVAATGPAGREIEHEPLFFIYRGSDFGTVEDRKGFHGGVRHAFVAIDERVALNQREAERRRLLN